MATAAMSACLLAQTSSPRPGYQILRQNEDWSFLANQSETESADLFDPLKYIRLSTNGALWVSFGGQIRERFESWNQFNFGAPESAVHNDGFLLSRLLLHADLHFGEHFRVFVQEKNSFSTHRALVGGRRTTDVDELDIQNGFLDFSVPVSDLGKLTFRAGRQELLFGRQRFVGVSDWSNTRRTFDGFSVSFDVPNANVTAFWTRPVKVLKYDLNQADHETEFFGVHSTSKVPGSKLGLDLYWYGLTHKNAVYDGSTGRETRHTLGGHTYGPIPNTSFDFDLGGGYQFGSVGVHDINAFMVLSQLGYSFRNPRGAPHFYIGGDYASGSRIMGGEVGTFNLLFPNSHGTLGYMDIVGRQNIVDLSSGFSLKPLRKLSVALDTHNFWRASANDALYDKRGNVVRSGAPGTSTRVGLETDLTFKYELDRHTHLEMGYGHFFIGAFIRESGPNRQPDWVYSSFQYTF